MTYVGRGGLKLEHALDSFNVEPRDRCCADFGANVGGFTDCLLQRGASRVYAVDTGYGTLAWTLRNDQRVVVMERTNALHAAEPDERPTLIAIDLGWTPQRHAVPAALRWLADGGKIISLIKPHYELDDDERAALLHDGVVSPDEAERIAQRTLDAMSSIGVEVVASTRSPITGGGSRRKRKGNAEWLALLRRA